MYILRCIPLSTGEFYFLSQHLDSLYKILTYEVNYNYHVYIQGYGKVVIFMNYLLFAITPGEIDETTIGKFKEESIFVRDYSDHVKEGITGHFYYEISNGESPSQSNPYNRIEEMHDFIEALEDFGKFKLVILESEQDAENLLNQEDGNIEKAFAGLEQIKIDLSRFLEKYPMDINPNKMYIIDNEEE